MAIPTVFISSTYYDLKHVRSTLEAFVRSLGFQSVLSEKGEIAYRPDRPLDDSCYRVAAQSDIFVLIVGGRYGSAASTEALESAEFHTRYKSITRGEYQAARDAGVPTYILIEQSVYAEYHTYRRNRERTDVAYAHVDSVNVFQLIDEILTQASNNPIYAFMNAAAAEEWLRLQWAGLFKELLDQLSEQKQLRSLAAEIVQLAESNKTLKRYLEEIVQEVAPKTSKSLIATETRRLEASAIDSRFQANQFVMYVERLTSLSVKEIERHVSEASSVGALLLALQPQVHLEREEEFATLRELPQRFVDDVNAARAILGLNPYPTGRPDL